MTYSAFSRIVPPQLPTIGEWLSINLVTMTVAPLLTEEEVQHSLWPARQTNEARPATPEEVALTTMGAEWRTRGWVESLDELLVDRAIRERWSGDLEPSRRDSDFSAQTTGVPTHPVHQILGWAANPFATRSFKIRVAVRGFDKQSAESWTLLNSRRPIPATRADDDRKALFGAFRAPFRPQWVALILGAMEPSDGAPQSEEFFAAGSVYRRIEVATETANIRVAAHYGFDDDYLMSLLAPDGSHQPLLSVAIGPAGVS